MEKWGRILSIRHLFWRLASSDFEARRLQSVAAQNVVQRCFVDDDPNMFD
jgi:hypothetical protein